MRRNFFEVVNVGENSTIGELKIYGVIGDWWDGNTATDFVRAFQQMEREYDEIHIHINSPGGSVHEGLAIANAIKSSKKTVHTFVDGIAYSMAASITLAAPAGNAHMAKGSLLMLHTASSYTYGNASEHREAADVLDKYDDALVSFVTDRTGQTLSEARTAFFNHKDNYFTPVEALALGLIDVVEDYEAAKTPDNIRNMTMGQVAAWYMGSDDDEPTESFMSKVISKVKNVINPENSEHMFNKFSKLSALAKVAANDISIEALEEVNNQIVEAGVTGVTVVTDSYLEGIQNFETENTTLKADKTSLETKITGLETSVTEKENRIKELEAEVKALGGKPAKDSGTPESKGDLIPEGDGGTGKETFETEYDREAMAMFSAE